MNTWLARTAVLAAAFTFLTQPVAAQDEARKLYEAGKYKEVVERTSGESAPEARYLDAVNDALRASRELAEEKQVTASQLAIAWVLAQGDDVVPIPGTKRRTYLEQNAGAAEVELTADDLKRISDELPQAAGDRYPAEAMKQVNV